MDDILEKTVKELEEGSSNDEIFNIVNEQLNKLAPEIKGILLHQEDGTPIVLHNAKHLLALTAGIDDELRMRLFLVIAHLKRYKLENEGAQQLFTIDGVIYLLEKLIAQSVEEKTK